MNLIHRKLDSMLSMSLMCEHRFVWRWGSRGRNWNISALQRSLSAISVS